MRSGIERSSGALLSARKLGPTNSDEPRSLSMTPHGLHNPLHNTRLNTWIKPTARPTPIVQSLSAQSGLSTHMDHHITVPTRRIPPPPSLTRPARCHRSVIVTGAASPVCLSATGTAKGIKNARHHRTSNGCTTKDGRRETTTRP